MLAEEVVTRAAHFKKILSPLGGNVVGKALPGIVINDPYKYISGKPGKYIYQIILEDNKNTNTKFEIHGEYDSKMDESRKWILKIDHDFIEEWQADNKGNVHLVAQTDIDSGYRVVLTPHLVLPAGAYQGQRWESESSLTAYEILSPDIIAYEGKLLSTKVYEGRFEVITPAGKFEAILISDEYAINIGAANIKDKRYTFYAPDVGKIAEIDGFHVSAFLVFHKRSNEVKVLMTLPQTTDEFGDID
ncbi:MAG TPA: hypothetical protein ENH23_03020 [candidate division Zixibacteria bacterium]|nr:hypothetical protein [candidate division Zixibacteria bacterium]